MTSRARLLGSVLIGALVAATGACSGSHGDPLAWPKLHATDDDGGESLDPRPKTQVAAEVATSEDKTPAPVVAPVVPAAAGSAAPAVAPTITAPEDVINTEEMTIEVDE